MTSTNRGVVRPCPDFAYVAISLDLKHPLLISLPKVASPLVIASCYGSNGLVGPNGVHRLHDKHTDLVITQEGCHQQVKTIDNDCAMLYNSSRRGILLVRALVKTQEESNKLRMLLGQMIIDPIISDKSGASSLQYSDSILAKTLLLVGPFLMLWLRVDESRGIINVASWALLAGLLGAVSAFIPLFVKPCRGLLVSMLNFERAGEWKYLANHASSSQGLYVSALLALSSLLGLPTSEAVYMVREELDCNKNHVFTFDESKIPAKWWSITAYGDDNFLMENPSNVYSIMGGAFGTNGTKPGVKRSQFNVGPNPPAEKGANWIPTNPKKSKTATLVMRLYLPNYAQGGQSHFQTLGNESWIPRQGTEPREGPWLSSENCKQDVSENANYDGHASPCTSLFKKSK